MQELTYFNGEFVEPGAKVISIDDRGYLFGDSVYEVVRVVKGRCFALSYHQDRLYRSMREMDIPVKMTPDDLMPVVWAIVRCARWALCRLAANPSSETTE